MAYPEEGTQAPGFSLPNNKKDIKSLKEYRGQWVVLYFYPKDNTPGCTSEAIEFSSLLKEFQSHRAVIIGVSPDSPESHARFIEKHGLSVILLSDEDKRVCSEYGVWQKKKNYGKEYMGVVRTTFLIDPKGIISKRWLNVKAAGHANEVKCSLNG